MADAYLGLTELILLNNNNLADLEMTDLLQDAPFLAGLHAELASNGTRHSYLVEDGAPVVGFRAINAGRENKKSSDRQVDVTLMILAATFNVDQQLAKNYKKGEAAFMSREARRHLKAAFSAAEKQIIYGTGNDSDGFTGMAQATTVDALSDTDHVVNAGGSSVGATTSVWAIRSPNDGTGVCAIMGQDGEITIGEYFQQLLQDGDGKDYPGYVQPIEGYMGLQIGSAYDMARIVNLTTQAGKGLTDTLMSQLMEKFPASRPPTHFIMNRQSRGQLQRSRTATRTDGADAPIPENYQGIPIICTDSILNTEAVVS